MTTQSMVMDNFFNNPNKARQLILNEPMVDYPANDGVTYPGIVVLPKVLEADLNQKFIQIFGNGFSPNLMFARHSYRDMNPPHWAHSDRDMTQMVGLIYLSHRKTCGTHLVKHKETGMFTHPEDEKGKEILMRDSNDRSKWKITDTFNSKYNRLVVLNAKYLHAAAGQYGNNRANSRLVLSVFFNLN